MNTQIWGFWGDTQDVELTPGVIDENAREAFTLGQCHALALGIHELTGWEMGGLGWSCQECGCEEEGCYCEADYLPGHVVVKDPDGNFVDVNGTPEDHWGDDFRPLDRETLTEHYPGNGYMTPDLDAGRAFAPVVLEEYGYEEYLAAAPAAV